MGRIVELVFEFYIESCLKRVSLLKKIFKVVMVTVVAAIVFVGGKRLLSEAKYDSYFDQIFISPNEINVILVRYDYGSRPTVFLNDKDVKIFEYPGFGFMENIHFDVEWKSDYEFVLYSVAVDECYVVIIPQEK